jgi:C-terminal processing protease CtpA/Prc
MQIIHHLNPQRKKLVINLIICISIFTGSPADKADLEVGDEILEVNGRSLEDATHTEVISHIHQV